jgi:rhodanese-related sulfurtransferase
MKRVLYLLFLVFSSCNNIKSNAIADQFVEAVELQALREREALLLLDVRTPEEFAEGHISGAVNIDYYNSKFDEHINSLDTSTPVLVYCHSGKRSHNTAQKLKKIGFHTIYELKGGIVEWISKGFSTTR